MSTHTDGARTTDDRGDRVLIFDTTLRDGEQSPGISLNRQEKLEIAQQLARLGVDVIEAGFPITSPGDFESVQAIAREVEGPGDLRAGAHQQAGHRGGVERRARRASARASTSSSPPATSTSSASFRPRARMSSARPAPRSPRRGVRRRCRVLARGRLALGHRVHGRGDPDRARGGRHHDQRPRHRRLHDARRVPRDVRAALRARARPAQTWSSRSTATTTWGSPSRTRWPGWKPAAGRSSARSTASASAPATPRWRRS